MQKLPWGQTLQDVSPLASWYLPAMHWEQAAAFVLGAMVPGAHAAGVVEPVEQAEPSGQSVHSVAAERPSELE